MQAYADGKEIECKVINSKSSYPGPDFSKDTSWQELDALNFNWERCDYRVKGSEGIQDGIQDKYQYLKQIARDTTKQIRMKGDTEWINSGDRDWLWNLPVSQYEVRDKPEPTKTIKLLAWYVDSFLVHRSEDCEPPLNLGPVKAKRAPKHDIEIEVEE